MPDDTRHSHALKPEIVSDPEGLARLEAYNTTVSFGCRSRGTGGRWSQENVIEVKVAGLLEAIEAERHERL